MKLNLSKIFAAILTASLLAGCAGKLTFPAPDGGAKDAPWSAVRRDCAGWAFSGDGTGHAEIVWRTKTKIPIIAAPLAAEGKIFVPTPNRRVLAFDAETGDRVGRLWVDVLPNNGIALGDGILAITGRSDFNRFRVYDFREGEFLWSKDADRAFSAPIVCGETIYFATAKGAIFAIDARTGERKWRAEIPSAVINHPPAFRDSLVYIADSNKRLVAITADSGKVRWKLDLPSPPVGQPIVIPDHVIVPTESGKIFVVLLDGTIRVTIDAPGQLATDIACMGPTVFGVTRMGIVFAGDLGGGGILWQTNLATPVLSAPVLWGRQLAVITAEGELNLVFYADGARESTVDLEAPVTAPPIVHGSRLFIAAETGELIAIERHSRRMEP
ncbi:MAG TPA: hypothetical protein ENN07_07040 [candidate division Zixibacteria bacterium]|nr:hypothetical protein [candidate division Zixibacteria bacterium]